ncbi:6390_t:CDS:1, partial [Gigaspora rosea]
SLEVTAISRRRCSTIYSFNEFLARGYNDEAPDPTLRLFFLHP